MKKRYFLFGLILILVIIFAFCLINNASAEENTSSTLLESSYNQKLVVLDKPVVLPDNLKIISKLLFGLGNSEDVTLSIFIVLIVFFAIIFSIIYMSTEFIPFFGNKYSRYIASFCITALISLSGGLREASIYLFDLSTSIKAIGNYGFFGIVLCTIVLIFILIVSKILFGKVRKLYKIQDSKNTASELVNQMLKNKMN